MEPYHVWVFMYADRVIGGLRTTYQQVKTCIAECEL